MVERIGARGQSILYVIHDIIKKSIDIRYDIRVDNIGCNITLIYQILITSPYLLSAGGGKNWGSWTS